MNEGLENILEIEGVKKEADQLMMNKMIKHQEELGLSYAAGLFDGEGCIVKGFTHKYNPVMKKKYLCTTIRMEVCNTDFGLIQWLHDFFQEGHIINLKPRKIKYGLSKPQQRWQLTHRQAYRVLKKILKYMKEKNKINKAKEVIDYYEKSEEKKISDGSI
jgi:hypothetical protein|tara:strand:+ start:1938 stop:2417 length:480 start_codon:yes stop_codon:yes gene_type:complete